MHISKTNQYYKKRSSEQNFFLFVVGSFISSFGTEIYTYAISLYVLRLTGSGLSYASTYISKIIPVILFNPIGGVLADKLDKKKLIVIMDTCNGLLFITLSVIAIKTRLTLPIILVSIFISSTLTTIFNISIESAKPNIVSKDKLLSINSASRIISSSSIILGPVLGGLVFAFIKIEFFMIVNGVSFIISAIIELAIVFKSSKQISNDLNIIEDIKEGLNYIYSNKGIINLFMLFIILNFSLTFGISIPMPYIVDQVLELGSKTLGIIQSGFPIGMIVGSFMIKKLLKENNYTKVLVITSLLIAVGMIIFGLPLLRRNLFSDMFYISFIWIILFLLGGSVACIDIPYFYLLQKRIPEYIRGRVISTGICFIKTSVPLASLLAGICLDFTPEYILPISSGTLLLFYSIVFYVKKKSSTTLKI
ncbi:MFS transporter [Clostridiaceae bacterium M8S5]|nr:MFS transporter [Clostridiaceae bacterium M8S5]